MKQLVLKDVSAKGRSVRYCYVYNGNEFSRGHDFDEDIDLGGYNDDPTFQRLLAYSALADSIYTFGLGYYDEIHLPFCLTAHERKFFETVFFKGLAEFRYVNALPMQQQVSFVWNESARPIAEQAGARSASELAGALVLNGGGKDGAVAVELAKRLNIKLAWFTSGVTASRTRMVAVSGVSDWVRISRYSDGYVNTHASLRGHKPMSFYVSMVASLAAYVTGRRYVIAANEYSASFPNLLADGVEVNHQYTKSSEYEEMLAELFDREGVPVRYFSITRPLYELQVMRIFATHDSYHKHFLSCNQGMSEDSWCLRCPKCAFVVGAMYVYNEKSSNWLWGDPRNVFAANQLVDELIELVNVEAKPLECIGTLEENRLLLRELLRRDMIVLDTRQQERLCSLLASGAGIEEVDFNYYDRPGYYPEELVGSIRNSIHLEMTGVLAS